MNTVLFATLQKDKHETTQTDKESGAYVCGGARSFRRRRRLPSSSMTAAIVPTTTTTTTEKPKNCNRRLWGIITRHLLLLNTVPGEKKKKKETYEKETPIRTQWTRNRQKKKERKRVPPHGPQNTHARNSTKRAAPSLENFKCRKINATAAAAPLILLPNRQKPTKKLKDKKGNH